MHRTLFHDRTVAGTLLGIEMAKAGLAMPVVLGLPRGGVPVAAKVAEAVGAPLDVIVVRKLGVPHQPELAMGAIGENGVVIVNEDVRRGTRTGDSEFDEVEQRERAELDRSLVAVVGTGILTRSARARSSNCWWRHFLARHRDVSGHLAVSHIISTVDTGPRAHRDST